MQKCMNDNTDSNYKFPLFPIFQNISLSLAALYKTVSFKEN